MSEQSKLSWEDLDPGEVAEAKRKAAGPLGQEFARFPLRFCAPVLWGANPLKASNSKVTNGTVSLLRLGDRNLGITCAHVLKGFRDARSQDGSVIFQIGNARLEILERVIDEKEKLDLAILDLDDISLDDMRIGKELQFFEQPGAWPPENLSEGDFVTLAGFPGKWKLQPFNMEVEFASWSLGMTRVSSVTEMQIGCLFEREYWVPSIGPSHVDHPTDLRGMSGGPVFIHRTLAWDFVGVIYEYSSGLDLLFSRPSSLVSAEGRLLL